MELNVKIHLGDMRKILLVIFLVISTIMSQAQTNFKGEWDKVEKLLIEQKNKDALLIIDQIKQNAFEENNAEQYIKALFIYTRANAPLDEKADVNNIKLFEKELPKLKFPSKQIVHNLIANLYYQYYQNNRWNIMDRTEVTDIKDLQDPFDIETWTNKMFFTKIKEHYTAALTETDKMLLIPITKFPALIEKGINAETLRPTVYDVLIHDAIDFYSSDEIEITKAADFFEIRDEKYFDLADDFIKIPNDYRDIFSTKSIALAYYKNISEILMQSQQYEALADVECARLAYVYANYNGKNKENLYKQALEKLIKKYDALWIMPAQVAYLQLIQDAEPNKALLLAKELLKKEKPFRNSNQIESIKNNLEQKNLSIFTEGAELPKHAILAKISSKNVEQIYIRVYPISLDEFRFEYQRNANEFVQPKSKYIHYKQVLNKSNWNEDEKLKLHNTEIKIDGLNKGFYLIAICEEEHFNAKKSMVAVSYMQISNLAYAYSNANEKLILIADRKSGAPIANAIVKRFYLKYDNKIRKTIFELADEYKSDEKGLVQIPKDKISYNTNSILVEKDDDKIWYSNAVHFWDEGTSSPSSTLFLFTDRAIYRPGQNVFVKGILINSNQDKNAHKLLANVDVDLNFRDANYQIIKTIKLKTNEYGSIHTVFTIPEALLNGEFTIESHYGSKNILVEEYKRPKFEVLFDTLKENYALNTMVRMTGNAKAYSGQNIDNAEVSYTVTRKVRFPFYWCWRIYPPTTSHEIVLSTGTTKTDANGKFEILFEALGDANIDKRAMPSYDFEVHVDVTDINGETHPQEKIMSLSEQALFISIDTKEEYLLNDFTKLKLNTKNSEGKFTPANVQLELLSLPKVTLLKRKKLWSDIDNYVMSKKEYDEVFYDYDYKEQSDKILQEPEKSIWQINHYAEENKSVNVPKTNVESGYYILIAKAKDKNGNEVIEKKVIKILENENKLLAEEALKIKFSSDIAAPGDVVKFDILSSASEKNIFYSIGRRNEIKNDWFENDKTLNIEDADRVNIAVQSLSFINNRIYETSADVQIPWTNKDLLISFETFRDKILPGSEQTWKIKISGNKKEKVAAEILSCMYDASLDVFAKNEWPSLKLFTANNSTNRFATNAFSISRTVHYQNPEKYKNEYYNIQYPYFIHKVGGQVMYAEALSDKSYSYRWEEEKPNVKFAALKMLSQKSNRNYGSRQVDTTYVEDPITGNIVNTMVVYENSRTDKSLLSSDQSITPRTDMSETAYFFPDLQTDANGDVYLKFKAPDALTRWNIKTLVHSKDLQSALDERSVITQKELMLTPNHPRFLREQDKLFYSTKISNLSDKKLNGNCTIAFINAQNEEDVSSQFLISPASQSFTIDKDGNIEKNWEIQIPTSFTAPLLVKIIARADNYSDGEQVNMPVLLNSMLVTETLPLYAKPNQEKNYSFEKLLQSGQSNTLKHYNLQVEFTSNPAWYAVQALPYLTDYPHDCAEQTFNRFYANALSVHIANANPTFKDVYAQWQDKDSNALISNLQKNENVKSALLQETPWVLSAKNETEQKRLIAQLFNEQRMHKELVIELGKLGSMQLASGAFPWFQGMYENRFITQYIVCGLGRLQHLGVDLHNDLRVQQIIIKAIPYLDDKMLEDYNHLVKHNYLKNNNLSSYVIQYLYARSYFAEMPMNAKVDKAFQYYLLQGEKYWNTQNLYLKAMLALVLNRNNKNATALNIMEALRQNAITKDEMGMYWKENTSSYWWYQAPIETQAILIEAFKEVAKNENEVDALKIWLLKQKQTQQWSTTKSTADACYALLLSGSNWLQASPDVQIFLGEKKVDVSHKEAGTGYFKESFAGKAIQAEMGKIKVSVHSKEKVGTTWGAVYWQYFEQLDKISAAATPLSIEKQLYKVNKTSRGEELQKIGTNANLKVGDKIMVRITLRVDRAMEFVHMKDMRASCFEPINVISSYKYQNGLGYYESTKDASTQFFFDNLQPGTYVFEYPMYTTIKGNFSNGITQIQCMYAPEFSSHSEGVRVAVE